MSSWTFDRINLLASLEKLKPMSGNKLNNICDNVKFFIHPVGDNTEANIYLYAAQAETNTCINHGSIKVDEGEIEPDLFLIDLKRLISVLKASEKELVVFDKDQAAEYDGDDLVTMAEYTVKTEGNNRFRSMDLKKFPEQDFNQGIPVAVYPAGVLPDFWKKAEVARGQLDIRYTCMHMDGNFCTLDGKFFAMVQPEIPFAVIEGDANRLTEVFSVNLESNISSIISQMKGEVAIKRSDNRGQLTLIDPTSGIYFSIVVSQPNRIPYNRILNPDGTDYDRHFVINRSSLIAAIKRATIFIDEDYDTRITITSSQDQLSMACIKIKASSERGDFEEDVPVIEITEEFGARYSAKNILRALVNCDDANVKVCWRKRDEPMFDRGILITSDQGGYKLYEYIPNQN